MTIKFQMGDDSPKGKKRLATAKGFDPQEVPASPLGKYKLSASGVSSMPITRNAQFAGSGANVAITTPMFFSPMHTPQNWQIASKRKEIYQWARFYYENEPKVAAGVDFYSQFPMNGFELECPAKKVRQYFEDLVDELRLNYWLKLISHEYFLIGDVFPFLEIDCPHCGGSGKLKNGKPCNHPDGKFKSITVLNPDFVEVEDSPFPGKRALYLIPDDTLKRLVQTRRPKKDFDMLPPSIVALVSSGHPIPLSGRSASHLKHSEVGYSKYGTSMLRRLFTILAYKTKLMTANWIIAERLILPVRVVKIGESEHPANADDIADIQAQLSAVANDPNLTIVTHHAFEYEWYGASGKIHNIQGEWEQIGKEILDGLMLNQALLNGEMQGYTSAQVGVETMIRRLENWRTTLSGWIEDHIFKPTAMMQGFIDEEASKEMGKTVYLYPRIKWNDMQLRDKTNKLQLLMQLHDKQIISTEKLCEEFDIDYDEEVERLRSEQVAQGAGGMMGAGGAGGAGGAMPGGAGGGMAGAVGAPGGGTPPGAPGDPMAGGMPGVPMGGAGGMPGAAPGGAAGGGMGAGAAGSNKVFKRGKAPKKNEEEQQVVPPTMIRLTGIEQKIANALMGMNLPFGLYAQYKQPVQGGPGQPNYYLMDFALPSIGIDIEADGKIWHEKEGQKEKEAMRDQKLAALGWRVLRFTEDAINEQMDKVAQEIYKNITEAAEERKSQRKKSSSGEGVKYSNVVTDYSYIGEGEQKATSEFSQITRGVNNGSGTVQSDEAGGSQENP
jgi:hypothetical protein